MGSNDTLGQYGHYQHGRDVYGGYVENNVTETASMSASGNYNSNDLATAADQGTTTSSASIWTIGSGIAQTAGSPLGTIGLSIVYGIETSSVTEIASRSFPPTYRIGESSSSVDNGSMTFSPDFGFTPESIATEAGGLTEESAAVLVENADGAQAEEASMTISEQSNLSSLENAHAVSTPIALTAGGVFDSGDLSKWFEFGATTATGASSGQDEGISTDTPSITTNASSRISVGEVGLATPPVSHSIAVGQMGTSETSSGAATAKSTASPQFASSSTGAAASRATMAGSPVYLGDDHTTAVESGSATKFHTYYLRDGLYVSEHPSVTAAGRIGNQSAGIIYEAGSTSSTSTVWTVEDAPITEHRAITNDVSTWTAGTARGLDRVDMSEPTSSTVTQDSASSAESPKTRHESGVTTTETGTARPVVGMSADRLPTVLEFAHAWTAPTVDATSPQSATTTGLAVANSTTTSETLLLASDWTGVTDGAMVVASNKQESPETSAGLEGGAATEGGGSSTTESAAGTGAARSTATFDPNVSPLAIANGAGLSGGPLSISSKSVVVSTSDLASVGERPDAIGQSWMTSPAFASGATSGSVRGLLDPLVLDGTNLDKVEIAIMTAAVAGNMGSTEGADATDTAPQTSAGNFETGDVGQADSGTTGVGETVTLSANDDALATDTPTVVPEREFIASETASATDAPFVQFSNVYGTIDFADVLESELATTEPIQQSTIDRALATDGPSTVAHNVFAPGELETLPTISEGPSMTGTQSFLLEASAPIRTNLAISSALESTAVDAGSVTESSIVLGDGLVMSTTFIPGLRSTVTILDDEKGYIYATNTKPTRSVVLGSPSGESIEVGPYNEVRIRSDTE